uniref:Uncharacterized protein n=1 Tax=Trypanosoma congolense (strain IL3000) TaxID=1068625 RepID=G0UNP1_TRYCI|nr:conserved hypothetical protein [Trypanosoma congolense IL3000]
MYVQRVFVFIDVSLQAFIFVTLFVKKKPHFSSLYLLLGTILRLILLVVYAVSVSQHREKLAFERRLAHLFSFFSFVSSAGQRPSEVMLHEVYAPKDIGSLVWSKQKINEFKRLTTNIRQGLGTPGPILLYGPTGCGKLSSVVTLLNHQFCSDAGTGCSSSVKVLHSCEATPMEYHQFLMGIFSDHCDVGGPFTGGPYEQAGNMASDGGQISGTSRGRCATVVKFYGEPLTSSLHSVTARFLKYYASCRKDTSFMGDFGIGPQPSDISILQRHILVLIFTTHDTHSDKVALRNLMPSDVLNDPCVHLFHCPPITVRNLTACIKRVLSMERKKRARHGDYDILSDEEINRLCTHSHGDIRHVILQTQWALLCTKESPAVRSPATPVNPSKRRRISLPRTDNGISVKALLMDSCDVYGNPSEVLTASKPDEEGNHDEAEGSNGTKAPERDIPETTIFRDDYLDVSHAAARILTQKHDLLTVIESLNVNPDKLLGYLTNNMLSYFRPDQMSECALCTAAASAADALRAPEAANRFRRSDAGLFTAALTGDERERNRHLSLDLVSLTLFGKAYVAHHKDVYIPNVFDAKRPPPYYPVAYPRVREVQQRSAFSTFRCSKAPYRKFGVELENQREHGYFATEKDWRIDCDRRLNAHIASGSNHIGLVADIIREGLPPLIERCGSLDSVLLEYAAYARAIILDYQPLPSFLSSSATPLGGKVAVNSQSDGGPGANSKDPALSSGPRRTLFSCVPAIKPVSALQTKRPCSRFRYNAICVGLATKPPIRRDVFYFPTREGEGEGEGDYDAVDFDNDKEGMISNFEYSGLPDGEELDDDSD